MLWFKMSLALGVIACGCGTPAPFPPPLPQPVIALAAQYNTVTAHLDALEVAELLAQTHALQVTVQSFTGLRFLRNTIENATSAMLNTELAFDIQGAIEAQAPCTGWNDGTPLDAEIQGVLDVTIGVQATRVQRAFTGHATNCRFLAEQAEQAGKNGASSRVVATMDVQVDLGHSVGFGDPASAILVRATNISGTVDGVALALTGSQVFSFRLNSDQSIATLLDLGELAAGAGDAGTVLLTLRQDGSWAVRTRDGEWVCGSEGSDACVLDDAA
jgi:hypothetical protein